MKKKIIIISILVLILLLAIGFIFRYQIGNVIFNIKMIGVDKDIIIEERGGFVPAGGYASTSYDYYIDLDKKKIYKVEDYYVFGVTSHNGEDGSHHTLTKTKKLNDNEINEILKITEIEESNVLNNNSSSSPLSSISSLNREIYYNIIYNGKTITLSKSKATALANVIDNMK